MAELHHAAGLVTWHNNIFYETYMENKNHTQTQRHKEGNSILSLWVLFERLEMLKCDVETDLQLHGFIILNLFEAKMNHFAKTGRI